MNYTAGDAVEVLLKDRWVGGYRYLGLSDNKHWLDCPQGHQATCQPHLMRPSQKAWLDAAVNALKINIAEVAGDYAGVEALRKAIGEAFPEPERKQAIWERLSHKERRILTQGGN